MPGLFHRIVQQTELRHELGVVPQSHGGPLGAADGEAQEEEVVEEAAADAVVREAAGGDGARDDKLPVLCWYTFSIIFLGKFFPWQFSSYFSILQK